MTEDESEIRPDDMLDKDYGRLINFSFCFHSCVGLTARWLVAEALVLGPVQCGVVLAAIQRDPAPCTFVQGLVLRIHPARRVLALSDCSLSILR